MSENKRIRPGLSTIGNSNEALSKLLAPERRDELRSRRRSETVENGRPFDAMKLNGLGAPTRRTPRGSVSSVSEPPANDFQKSETPSQPQTNQVNRNSSSITASASTAGQPTRSDGLYEILREIGRGTFTTVFEAYDHSLHRYVAIRQLVVNAWQDPRQTELFWKEAQFFGGVNHENLVSVYAVEPARGWVILERMSGNLQQKMASGPLSPDAVRSILMQALRGLSYLHHQNKLHGEIKPSSLLIDEQGRVKLCDSPGFTVGGEFRAPTGAQRHIAPELLSPETFGTVGCGVDLYCLGFTALDLLLGGNLVGPFKGIRNDNADDRAAWLRWHTSSESLPPTREFVPSIPHDLALVLDRLTQKHVADRYPSADAALADLENHPLVLLDPTNTVKVPSIEGVKTATRSLGTPTRLRSSKGPPKISSHRKRMATDAKQQAMNWFSKPVVFYPLCIVGLLFLFLVLMVASAPAVDPAKKSTASSDVQNDFPQTKPTIEEPLPDELPLSPPPPPKNTNPSGDSQPPPPSDGGPEQLGPMLTACPEPDGDCDPDQPPPTVSPKPPAEPPPPPPEPSKPIHQSSRRYLPSPQVWAPVGIAKTAQRLAFRSHVYDLLQCGFNPAEGDWARHYEAAVGLGPDDPRAHHAAGITMLCEFERTHDTTARTTALLYFREATDAIRRTPVPDAAAWRHYIYLLAQRSSDRATAAAECYFLIKSRTELQSHSCPAYDYEGDIEWVGNVMGYLAGTRDSPSQQAEVNMNAGIETLLASSEELLKRYSQTRDEMRSRAQAWDKRTNSIARHLAPPNLYLETDKLLKTLAISYYGE